MRPHGSMSPRKTNVRRSDRARSSVYMSLGENDIGGAFGVQSLVEQANERLERERRSKLVRASDSRYPTRSTSKFVERRGDSTEDDEQPVQTRIGRGKGARRAPVQTADSTESDEDEDYEEDEEARPSRSLRKRKEETPDGEEDEEEEEEPKPTSRQGRSSGGTRSVAFEDEEGEEVERARSRSCKRNSSVAGSPVSTNRNTKRRKILLDSEDDEPASVGATGEPEEADESMHDRLKRRQAESQPAAEPESKGLSRAARHERRERMLSGMDEDEEEEEGTFVKEEKESSEDEEETDDKKEKNIPLRRERKTVQRYTGMEYSRKKAVFDEDLDDERPIRREYPLRRERKTVERYSEQFSKTRTMDGHRMRRHEERMSRSDNKRRKRHRITRSDSESTGSSSDEGGSKSRKGRKHDELSFAERKERSMAKARQRFLPINLDEHDIKSKSDSIRDKLLGRKGASCSDIDPMTIDNTVFFDQVGGLGPHIQTLKEVVLFPMLYPEVFSRFSINPPKGVVFYGPPGTGKTLVARALANECSKGAKKVSFFMRKGADCLSKWVGESERQLRLLFDQAYAMRPSIIFFDEIDGLAPVRSSRQDQIHASIVSTLLALMDGLDSRGEVVVIGATNRLDTLDPALRRPGRFDRELKFNLPDSSARLQIMEIHTKDWAESRPSPETLQWMADSTSGYCGADLKFLATEAVLIALREKYPHIYMSKEKLAVDPAAVTIERRHLQDSMRRIVPASRRDLSIPSRPLDERTSLLMASTLQDLLTKRVPSGYRCSSSVQNSASVSELEKVVKALEPAPIVPAVRLLLTGNESCRDAGQSSFLLPAMLARLDHLPIFSLAVGKIFADGRPEEALAQTMQAALRAAATTPAILLLPNVDQWYDVVPSSVSHMLVTALENLTGFTSLLFVATCEGQLAAAAGPVKALFRTSNAFEVPMLQKSQRRAYFEHIMTKAIEPPRVFDPSQYIAPPIADQAQIEPRKLTDSEKAKLKKEYSSQTLQLRIFLRDTLAKLMRDRRFNIFVSPVDVEDAPDYYEHIAEPLCMTDMMAKLDRREYCHPDEFIADIDLIMRNALEYNPATDLQGKQIRHDAIALRDMADGLFDMDLNEGFVEKLEETARMIKEGAITMPVIEIPFSKTPIVANTTHSRRSVHRDVAPVDNEVAGPSTSMSVTTPRSVNRKRHYRGGTYSFSNKKKVTRKVVDGDGDRDEMEVDDKMDVKEEEPHHESAASDESQQGKEAEAEEHRTSPELRDPLSADRESAQSGSPPMEGKKEEGGMDVEKHPVVVEEPKGRFTMADSEIVALVNDGVKATRGFPVPEMERLAADLLHEVDLYKDIADKTDLLPRLRGIMKSWATEFKASSAQESP